MDTTTKHELSAKLREEIQGIGALVLLASIVTLVLTWPTRRRRGVAPQEKRVDGEQEKVDQP